MKKIYSLFVLVVFLCYGLNAVAQDLPTSVGPAPVLDIPNSGSNPSSVMDVNSRGFVYSSTTTHQLAKQFMGNTTLTNIGAPQTYGFPGAFARHTNGTIYVNDQLAPYGLYTLDTTTGAKTLVVNITGITLTNLTGITWDGTQMWGVQTNITQSQIGTISLSTGAFTAVGSASAICAGAIQLNAAPNGTLFSVDIVADNLYKWNKTTGVPTLVGALGVNANFGQDGHFDMGDGKYYWAAYTTAPMLRIIDTTNGSSVQVGTNYAGQTSCLAIVPFQTTPAFALPDVLYYKFRLNPNATTVTNFATNPPAGTSTATLTGQALGSGGQFDSCMVGTSLTGTGATHNLNTNWTTNIGTSSFTIGLWLGNISNQPGTSACYLFGDPAASAFRCFWAGAGVGATDTAILFRYTGMPDMRLPLTSLTNAYVHFVYDSAASTLKSYKNGVFVSQVTWTGINLTGAGPFKVGGYSTSANSMLQGMKMDEFRVYKRALGQAEITGTWNNNLGVLTGITEPVVVSTPVNYQLSQNYPNPFNPTTKISFALPKSGLVTLKVYDILGKEVATLVNEVKNVGNYSVDFSANNLSSGVYFYKLSVGDFSSVKKMTLLK